MTTAITLRATKGSPLTHNEMDTNLTNLQTTADDAAAAIVTLGTKAEAAALGVTASDLNMGSFTGTTISDSVTAKVALQSLETAVETKANATALGVTASAAHMGTFTGSTIADNQTAKVGMQSLETAVELRTVATTLAASGGSALVGHIATGSGAVAGTAQTELRRWVYAEQFGFSTAASAADNATALLAAITSIRSNSVSISTDGLGSGAITVYSSGEILIGPGTFAVAPDVLQITQDLGLTIKGKGSRRQNNAVLGRTVLLITGTSSGYGIQVKGNGARGLTLEDIDLCYATSGFTGDVLDIYGAPGVTLNRVHLGTHGITGGTRLQTAQSLIRTTYDEFLTVNDCALDGAVDGWWSDDVRDPPTGTNEFGGSATAFRDTVFYDFTGAMVKALGNRNRKRVILEGVTFNPISVDCTRAIDFNNVDALTVSGCYFTPSTSYIATSGWLRLVNCTGKIEAGQFLGTCAVGTIDGNLAWNNNFVDATTGPEVKGGIVTGCGNEYSAGTAGIALIPTRDLCFRLGPDNFKADVDYSYDIATDSAYLDGHIIYSATQDASTNRFRNVSARVAIRSNDEKRITISDASYTVLATDTGRKIELTAAPATATLPAVSNVGLKFSFFTNSTNLITIAAPAGTLYVGDGAAKTSMVSTGDTGSFVTVENFAGAWNVTERIGDFTYA